MNVLHISKHQDPVIADLVVRMERYVARVRQEYNENPTTFAYDITRQEAAIMNIVRAASVSQDIAQHLIRKHKLGVPQSYYDVYNRIEKAGLITVDIACAMKKVTDFRETALHDDQYLKLEDLECLILEQLRFFLLFSNAVSDGKPHELTP